MAEYLRGGRVPRSRFPRATIDQFTLGLEDDVLYLTKQKTDGTILYVLVVPQELRKAAMHYIHDKESGHLGQHKTILKAEEYFYWTNIKQNMRQFVRECVVCQQFKAAQGLQQPWQELPPANQLLERINIDTTDMGGGAPGRRYVLTVIDHFSQFVNFYPMNTRTSVSVIQHLDTFLDSYDTSHTLLAVNAREFCSEDFRQWCNENGIELVHSTPYHPAGNSISERMHRTMKSVLTTLCKSQPSRWPRYIKPCQRILNSAVH